MDDDSELDLDQIMKSGAGQEVGTANAPAPEAPDPDPQADHDQDLRDLYITAIDAELDDYIQCSLDDVVPTFSATSIKKMKSGADKAKILAGYFKSFWTNPVVRERFPFLVFIARRFGGIPATSASI